ncbi:amidase [Podospora didyma]|uniref:Amidase n=1 Tax=Podospora didyma TaxID=330526 RepID=A0AAE0U3E8_9PEZI|nr:amidase [Podospora didyma]
MALFRPLLALVWAIASVQIASGKFRPRAAFPSLIDATVDDIKAALDSQLFTSVDLVNAYLRRIAEANPIVNAVTEVNPDALSIAAALDAERAQGKIRSDLHGVPILIKNNIATADAMNNTAGSLALLGALVPRDSFIASKLRAAGAIILGKSNLSQWANFRSSNSSNGWSAHGGQVSAAYIKNQDPSGSSSGSGVATSLGLVTVSLGTETDGSIISPSQRNNLVGVKPSVGLTSRDLVIPISEHQDTVGPMGRTVKDAAYVLQAIAGPDRNDNYTSAIPTNSIPQLPDYVGACTGGISALRGARLGVPTNAIELFQQFLNGSAQPEVDAFSVALDAMRVGTVGAVIVRDSNFTNLTEWASSTAEGTVLRADFRVNLASYLSKLTTNPNNVSSLSDIRRFTQLTPEEDFPSRDTVTWDEALDAETGFDNTDPRFWPALQEDLFLGGEGGLLGALERYRLDAVVLPSSFAPGFAAIVGAPVVTVPLGFYPPEAPVVMNTRGDLVDTGPNVPFGFSFLGRNFDEVKLIGLAYAFEQLTQVRGKVRPYLVPTKEVSYSS